MNLFSQGTSEHAVSLEYNGDKNGNRVPDPTEIGIHPMQGDGDFNSEESIALLKQADIVVTNPPFSLFGDFVSLMFAHNKKFIIIGHQNALTYTSVFPFIRDNRLWLGYGFKRNMAHFNAPHYEDTATDADHREGMIRVSGVVWYTNVDHNKRHEEMTLVRRYKGNEKLYPTYDNYDAIEVARTQDIPMDYKGAMGVPITFMTKYNPEQFEILGVTESEGTGFSNGLWKKESRVAQALVNGVRVYKRIFIRNLSPVESEI